MLPSTPHASATRKSISPFATRYPAGGMPSSRNRSSSQCTNDSSIEAMLSEQGDEPGGAQRGVTHLAGLPEALDQRQSLGAARTERDQEPAAGGQLLHEGRRHLGSPRGDE